MKNLSLLAVVLGRDNERSLCFLFQYFAEVVHLLEVDSLFVYLSNRVQKLLQAFYYVFRDH